MIKSIYRVGHKTVPTTFNDWINLHSVGKLQRRFTWRYLLTSLSPTFVLDFPILKQKEGRVVAGNYRAMRGTCTESLHGQRSEYKNDMIWYRGTPRRNSRNSGNKCQLARPLMLPNFVTIPKEVCEISAVENVCSRKSGLFTKIYQDLLRNNVPHCAKFHPEKALQFFYTLQYFGVPGGPCVKIH